MSPSVFNIAIHKGSDFKQTFEFRHGLRLVDDLLPGNITAPTNIRIDPLSIDLPANYRLRFPIKPYRGCTSIDLTTATVTAAGADLVSISPYTQDAKIPCGSIAKTLPQDLTGQIWRGAIRKEYSDAAPLLQFTFAVDPLLGLVIVRVPATLTTPLLSNAIYSDLPENLQTKNLFLPRIWQNAYFWDAEYELPTGDVYRAFQGRAWVTPEATR
jgi:hypothetical protein